MTVLHQESVQFRLQYDAQNDGHSA